MTWEVTMALCTAYALMTVDCCGSIILDRNAAEWQAMAG